MKKIKLFIFNHFYNKTKYESWLWLFIIYAEYFTKGKIKKENLPLDDMIVYGYMSGVTAGFYALQYSKDKV